MNGSSERKLLLSSVCQPFGVKHGDGFGVSYEGSHQIMWAQGVFKTRATTTQWGIDFIAENLQIPTITLHYPTMDRFIAEIRKGYRLPLNGAACAACGPARRSSRPSTTA